jgi:hypothetical protein
MRDLSTPVRLIAAIAPMPFFVWLLAVLIRAVQRCDELERRIQLEALALAYPLGVVVLMALGLVELVAPLPREDWSYRHVWQMFIAIYIVALLFARWRYHRD